MTPKKKRPKRKSPAARIDAFVDVIAEHKAGILAASVGLACVLALAVLIAVGENDGDRVTTMVTGAGGYVAIAGFVLGLPALSYAMVTDRAVEELTATLSVTKHQLGTIRDRIRAVLTAPGATLPPHHETQVFVPNREQTRLRPIYDPKKIGPKRGWKISEEAPQAVTGSAWVANRYFFALRDQLADPALRLTPEQRKRYSYLTGVAAAPIQNQNGEPVGVLTVFSDGDPKMDDPEFIETHLRLAKELSPIIREYAAAEGPLEFPEIAPDQAPGHHGGSISPSG